jgi:hypothetical protein
MMDSFSDAAQGYTFQMDGLSQSNPDRSPCVGSQSGGDALEGGAGTGIYHAEIPESLSDAAALLESDGTRKATSLHIGDHEEASSNAAAEPLPKSMDRRAYQLEMFQQSLHHNVIVAVSHVHHPGYSLY